MNPTDLLVQNAIGGFMNAFIGQLSSPENMQQFVNAVLQPHASYHCKNPADAAIAALKCYKNGQLSKAQALEICAIALREERRSATIDAESLTILESLFKS